MKVVNLQIAKCYEESCDTCDSQEGSHYCLLHSIQIKNMDLMRCKDHKSKETDHE